MLPRWPPPEPEPGQGDLADKIDWMTYSHRELYDMVHNGLDLAGATAVAAQWADIGEALDDIGEGLRKAIQHTGDDWQGEAADSARDVIRRLIDWTTDTADRGRQVSGCVSRQADNAETARRTMPVPPPVTREAVHPGSSTDFSSAAMIARDRRDPHDAQQLHQQAAAVMERLQRDSNEVYGTVPAFTKPLQHNTMEKTPSTEPPPPDQTVAAGADPLPVHQTGQPAPGAGGRTLPGPGEHSSWAAGQVAARPAAGGVAASAARATSVPGGTPMMGTGAGARREEDIEHSTPSYLQEDSDFWNAGVKVIPPVIGE